MIISSHPPTVRYTFTSVNTIVYKTLTYAIEYEIFMSLWFIQTLHILKFQSKDRSLFFTLSIASQPPSFLKHSPFQFLQFLMTYFNNCKDIIELLLYCQQYVNTKNFVKCLSKVAFGYSFFLSFGCFIVLFFSCYERWFGKHPCKSCKFWKWI